MDFNEALMDCFKFWGRDETDNLPILATARYRRGNEGDFGRNGLARMMRLMDLRRGVEIGTHRGLSARMWCKANPDMELLCVDPYKAYMAHPDQSTQNEDYARAVRRLSEYKAVILRKTSMEAVVDVEDESIDFVYIDGDHRFDPVMMDLLCWAPKVRKGGLIMLHDYYPFRQAGVIKAIDAYTHCHHIDPWYITRDHMPTAFWQKGVERA